ncbi:MAG: thioredoxin domain-containing protein [Gemmatimonadales bacterium]|nr:MAG: thioredoxin domain-containing protein [Gemmatimonadales bacterium]
MRDLSGERSLSLGGQSGLTVGSRLASERSPYLRSAAHQPVDWYPWCEEAFERARAEGKPILLDIGASWCHWCHVMDSESYEDPAIAELLNRDWICIKVDRDERPDVDARYQRAVQVLTGQGGWPLTAFLTPSGEVFYGGTYFPPDGKYGRPGFASVLRELARLYRQDPGRVSAQASEIRRRLEELSQEVRAGPIDPSVLEQAVERMARVFDFRYGGFGTQPKFPHPAACDFLLARWFDTREVWLREMVDRTLLGMARGGIHDHVGGGFHRYSVDARWIVPHFEKMSYDNSELLRAYVHADSSAEQADEDQVRLVRESAADGLSYRHVIEGIVRWVTEVLAQQEGGYGASQDADAGPGDDGDYFTWTPEEVRAAVTEEEYQALCRRYDIDEAGEMSHNPRKNVLWIKQSIREIATALRCPPERVAELLVSGRAKLKAARDRRPAPAVDRSLYTGWNAMLASAMLESAAHLDRPELENHALATLERIFKEAAPDPLQGAAHAPGSTLKGILEDQVQLAAASLDAYEATGSRKWLARTAELMTFVWSECRAGEGLLLDVAQGYRRIGLLDQPLRPLEDAPTPSGNGVAALVMLRLAFHDRSAPWRERAEELLRAASGALGTLSLYAATMLRAADWYLNPATYVVIVGDPDEPGRDALLRAARRTYRPRKVIVPLEPKDPADQLPQPLQAMLSGQTPRAYLCCGVQCAAPTSDPSELALALATFRP